jgi:aspartate dehydrogenase
VGIGMTARQVQSGTLRVGIAGFGAIGRTLAERIDRGMDGVALTAIAVRDPKKSAQALSGLRSAPVVCSIEELPHYADVVIECAPAALLPTIAVPVLEAGKTLIVLSVGALLFHPQLTEVARKSGAKILVPTGALLGLDAISAAAQGKIHSVRMTTRKPVRALAGAPFLAANNIRLDDLREPMRVFAGSAREAAKGFPANLNVAVALSLAGIGPDRTMIEVWADPAATVNSHRIDVDSDSARLTLSIENVPSENPKTGKITALSVIALLRKLTSPLRIGT